MPNMKKITAPRNTTIKGQPHQLAYINDAEQGLLMALGGSGKPVNGVPAYFLGEGQDSVTADTYSGGDTFSGGGSSDDDEAFSEYAGVSDAAKRAAIAEAESNLQRSILEHGALQSSMTPEDFAFDTGPSAEQRIAQSRFDYADVFGPEIYSPEIVGQNLGNLLNLDTYRNALAGKGFNLGGVRLGSNYMDIPSYRDAFANMAIDRVQNRIDGYNNDQSFLGQRMAPINSFFANNIIKGLEKGGRPVLDATGRVMGVFNKGPFGLGEVYTGMPVEGVAGTGFDNMGGGGISDDDVKPANPLTGQCPAGYVFDDDINACRVDTGSGDGEKDAIAAPDGLMYRRGLLDDAPAFMPAGMDFDEMNTAFRRTAAYNPDNFENQMDTTGFTILK